MAYTIGATGDAGNISLANHIATPAYQPIFKSLLESSALSASFKFELMEPYLELELRRSDGHIDIDGRIDLSTGIGPEIATTLISRLESQVTLDAVRHLIEMFPAR